MFNKSTASDPTYHSRHAQRTLARAKRIAAFIDRPGQLLDVGCNNGITSAYMLDSGKAKHVTGIELQANTVDDSLLTREEFTLIEGNVVELELNQAFDHIIYGAVHHHILNLFGLSAAVRTLQDLAGRCKKSLFFETGQITEGGRWSWQTPMRQRFRTDEEHFFYLVRSIEHLISDFEVIGKFWIHGIRRYFLRFDIRQDIEPPKKDFAPWPERVDGPWVRTFGSRQQELIRATDSPSLDSPTQFWIAGEPGHQLFVKKHVHMPIAAEGEWSVGKQVDRDWAVRPIERVGESGALTFPYLQNAKKVVSMRRAPKERRRAIATAVIEILRDAFGIEITLSEGLLLSQPQTLRLIDVIDCNANNLLLVSKNSTDAVKLIDLEVQSTAYRCRNRIHVAGVLWSIGQRRAYAGVLFIHGWAGVFANLFRFQFVPFAQRVALKQPSFLSFLIAEIRNVTGKITGRLLRMIGLD